MRIRDRLFPTTTPALSPYRQTADARGAQREAVAEPDHEEVLEVETDELPGEVLEHTLQSIATSQTRLLQATEAVAVIASAVAHADATLRRRSSSLTSSPGAPALAELVSAALEAANLRGADGSYLLIGDHAASPPFSPNGAFLGAAALTSLIIVPGPPPGLAVAASALTSAAPSNNGPQPVDILPLLDRLARAPLSARPFPEAQDLLLRAASQLAHLQSKIALALSVLADAASLGEDRLLRHPTRAERAERGMTRAVQIPQTFGAIEAARSLAERTLALFPLLLSP